MLFWLKKFVSFWLMPLPFCVTAIAVGLVLMRSAKRARLGRALIVTGLALLILFSNKFVSCWLIRPLETRYPPIPEFTAEGGAPPQLRECRFVVVLGGGNGLGPDTSANNLLSSSALARIVEATRICRVLPDAQLIVSGPGDTTRGPTHAEVLARAAESLGIARSRILKIEDGRDTEEEAQRTRQIAGERPVALVTSAWHLPRAVALCRNAGLNVVPCPSDFTSHANDALYFDNFLWDVQSLERSTLAVRERIGYLWIWLRGKN